MAKSNGTRINPFIAGAAGAVAGAAGAAIAVALSDKKTREKMGKSVKSVSDYTIKTMNDLQTNSDKVSSYAGNMVKGGKSTKTKTKKGAINMTKKKTKK